jgi:hypothetical protein
VANDAIFSGGVHPLEDDQDRVLVRRIEQLLKLLQALDMFRQRAVVISWES